MTLKISRAKCTDLQEKGLALVVARSPLPPPDVTHGTQLKTEELLLTERSKWQTLLAVFLIALPRCPSPSAFLYTNLFPEQAAMYRGGPSGAPENEL
jgi:hypothetical protein